VRLIMVMWGSTDPTGRTTPLLSVPELNNRKGDA